MSGSLSAAESLTKSDAPFRVKAQALSSIQGVRLVPKNELSYATKDSSKCPALQPYDERNSLSFEVERQVGYILSNIFPCIDTRVVEVQTASSRGHWAQCTELDVLWGTSTKPIGFLEVKTCTGQLHTAQDLVERATLGRALSQVETQGALLSMLNPEIRGGVFYVVKDELPPPAFLRNGEGCRFIYGLSQSSDEKGASANQLKQIIESGFNSCSIPVFVSSMAFISQTALQMGYLRAD